ncbi:MAG: 16S rRNA (cytosine(967)-C(5))-methyltransferase RsmB [Lachnospiraceae bacterium]|nr:16S rRNA (cytosine(967)-C(5))-methyltransferase RsmB [Lachnospiraceae bacterium]
MNIREIVLDILLELEKNGGYVNVLLSDVLDKYDYLMPKEKAFIKRVTQGTVERRIQLDYALNQISKVQVNKMKPLIRQLLRMSAYQLIFMDAVPDSAVCNEAVKLAKKRKFMSLQGYVNGVLRNLAAAINKQTLSYPDASKEPVLYLSVMYSMPEWLVEHFMGAYGVEDTEKILAAFLNEQPVTLRIEENISKDRQDELIKAWGEKGVIVKKHPYLPYAMQIEKIDGVRNLSGYEEGFFMVQDVSSMLVVEAAGIKAGQTVIDVCASPGGKSLHAASKLAGTGKVLSFDLTETKVERLEENRRRMHGENMVCEVGDARIANEKLYQLADVVLADVPCSGLGVIGKKQDIKYNVTPESIEEITILQKDILKNVANYVKPGGVLMYSTCTINPAENEEMVEWFCDTFSFEPESMSDYLPQPLKEAGANGMIQLLPGIHETDGFFFARLRRVK